MSTLAIDQGTTSTRALMVGRDGSLETIHSLAHRQIYPAPDHVEHDPEELIRNIRACLDAAGDVEAAQAIGLDNQGESCLAWNAETGRAIGNVIVWQDGRTRDVTARLQRDGVEPMVLERAGLPLDPYFSASKLGWLMRENAEVRRLAATGKLRLGTTDAFFRDRLTGRFETDVTTASRTSLMNLESCSWDEELCRLFGVPIEALPTIGSSTGDFGMLACGAHRAPLTASLVDQQAALYGHGCRTAGDAKITFGTGAFALQVTGELIRPVVVGPLPTIAWQKWGEKPTYALDGGVFAASSAVNWARQLGLFTEFSEIDAFACLPAIERGLIFVPALAGLACPHWDRAARGAWLGLSLDTGRGDLMQALLEGVALRMAEVIAAMQSHVPLTGVISLDGGMTANTYFCQFLADTLGRELIVSDQPELTAIGTAALAGEAAGHPIDFSRTGITIQPRGAGADRLVLFQHAVAALRAYHTGSPIDLRP